MSRSLIIFGGCLMVFAGWLSAFFSQAIPLQSDFYYLVPALLLGVGIGIVRKQLNAMRTALAVFVMAALSIATVNQVYPDGKISVIDFLQRMEKEVQKGKPVILEVREEDRKGVFAEERKLAGVTDLRVQLYARLPGGTRMMAFDPLGRLYVSIPELDAIYQLTDSDKDGFAEQPLLYHVDLDRPHGLIWSGNTLYVAETSRLLRLRDKDQDNQVDEITVLLENLPDDGGHWTRSLAVGNDGKLYLSVGSRCNACDEADKRRATVLQVDPETGESSIYAKGLRNTVGLAFSGDGKALWGSDNGRDMLGDNLPPDEINKIFAGADYGWPRCFGDQVADPELFPNGNCSDTIAAAVDLPAHSAPLGIAFGDGLNAPEGFRQSMYVAFHGSWNRSQPTGYKLVRIPFTNGRPDKPKEFLFGWLQGTTAWGRPVAPLVGPDGSLYLSDDRANAIYRITWPQQE
ncbi:Glucose/arabinose dehydrogenase, beta-propeller fold [Malonomonas rubra DSM 5091]|uniref:Glucose/arabinose dehydrogenase, beta-propeller fold n=1 Tax=Malonomonas rubra DSM 5091 TaxID=1122189 RepID=A0A1M6LHY4_MALRU|nr:PQQ-dependent sugar dehydrogenase [Malonomonas rubra]SHJ70778.1 Glucose/arabinose dehydrogenase, beta-propeller fold [Malonomonas rubra DSM 5091]